MSEADGLILNLAEGGKPLLQGISGMKILIFTSFGIKNPWEILFSGQFNGDSALDTQLLTIKNRN